MDNFNNHAKENLSKFHYLPIRSKLIMIIMTATLTTVVLLCSVFVIYEYFTFRQQLSNEFATTSEIIADRSTAALLFNDKVQLKENISSFRIHKMVQLACVYSEDKKLLASFSPAKLDCPININPDTREFKDAYFHLTQPIISDGKEEGLLYVRVSLAEMHEHLATYFLTTIVFALIAAIVVYLISSVLQRFISRPLLMLKDTVDQISQKQDYTLRATKVSYDEIGELTDAINNLVSTIESQNRTINQYAEGLENQVAYRTQDLEVANQELEAFSYSVSHDLRAPLRAIDGFSQALLEDYEQMLDQNAQDYIQRVRSASQKMGGIITSLLQLSRVSRWELKVEDINLADLFHTSIEQLQNADTDRRVIVEIMNHIPAKADRQLLSIAIDNLVGNAWKYCQYKTNAKIEMGCFELDEKTVYFVRDNGAGYDAKNAKNLFTAFQRLHSPNEFDGTGIGLATVSRIINRHHGKIWSDSLIDEGATFYFTLNYKKTDHL
jgi:signal transduction histidine kinase